MAREEVVIGDSTEDEEEVRIVAPQSRKRRRRSNIMLDHDEEEEEETKEEKEEEEQQQEEKETPAAAPRRQQQLVIGQDGVGSQPMTLRTPTPTRRSRRNMQQLSISAAVARGERGRQREAASKEEHSEAEEEDDDDEVCIILPPAAGSVRGRGSSGRKKRPAIHDSDEEPQKERRVEIEDQESDKEEVAEQETSSASRRSSRIEHKRQEKEAQHFIARKLDYPMLDNCLDNLQSLGPHYQEGKGDDDDDEDYHDSETEEAPPPKKRRRPVPREGDWDNQEKVYADGGEDVDDFICDDDEIEYMDDDEEGVISVDSSDNDIGDDDPEELTAILSAGRSREMNEWFTIYLEYLEECILDPEFERKMHRKRSKANVRSGVAWPEEMVDALKVASQFRSSHVSAEQDCDACNRRQHVATYHVELTGAACDATKLYGNNWMLHLKEAAQEAEPVRVSFEMGNVCHARTLAYWQLLHAKQFWCIIVNAKLKECADSSGRIGAKYRDDFFKREFGRYKMLVELVEKFADDSKRIAIFMPNSWKKITPRNVTSDFLPSPSYALSRPNAETRRGTLDAFVAESEEEGSEDEEAIMEKIEEQKLAVVNGNDDAQATDEEEEARDVVDVRSPRRTPRSESKKEERLQITAKDGKGGEDQQLKEVKDEKLVEKDIDDLMCLVCDASPRNAGVVHGLYLHVYCCYACAKRLQRMKCGCMVCNRPIDRVLRLLPLTLDARKAIRNQQKKS
ncbi:unnamed protein product [Phytophthora fragariaefolia]|uniref:Unnamed protein product n=1 Tax=Phytophthora fragariaefolia TaxID=1490495 RepID=A0A9W6TW31_9STRA|nr:unnamed protein product [Phytophthora fragariaefolia]